jgi:hemerythrin superfamily protein
MSTSTKRAPKSGTRAAKNDQDALSILMADHKKVQGLFKQFEELKGDEGADEEKGALAKQVCNELTVHAQIEEEIFYPAVRKAIEDSDLMDEAEVEHAGAKELIAQLEDMDPNDELYDAKVTVLGEQINHHVKEEEGEMFPKVKKSQLDTAALGAKMSKRKVELMEEMGLADEEFESEPVSKNSSASKRRF